MDSDLDEFAQIAGREFVAAGRAETAEERRRHREAAVRYVDLIFNRRRTASNAGHTIVLGDS